MPLPPPRVPRLLMRVWDAPVRLFHVAAVVLIACAYATYHLGRMDLHGLAGDALLALLLFRLAWGFVGSETARFSAYLVNPLAGLARRREPDSETGHGAAGGWIVLVLLLALAAECVTGISAARAGAAPGALGGGWPASAHAGGFYVLLALLALHLVSLAACAAAGRQGLVQLMVTGKKRLPAATRQPRLSSPILALALLAVAAGLAWALARLA